MYFATGFSVWFRFVLWLGHFNPWICFDLNHPIIPAQAGCPVGRRPFAPGSALLQPPGFCSIQLLCPRAWCCRHHVLLWEGVFVTLNSFNSFHEVENQTELRQDTRLENIPETCWFYFKYFHIFLVFGSVCLFSDRKLLCSVSEWKSLYSCTLLLHKWLMMM